MNNKFICLALSLLIISQSIFVSYVSIPQKAKASEETEISPEDNPSFTGAVDSIYDLDLLLSDYKKLVIAPQDVNSILDYKVDVRVTDYLIYLVTPINQGGAGLPYVKVARLLKNYDTKGVGKYDRETLSALEEDNQLVSAHNTGQAVDISEAGNVTCKLIEKRHVGGNKTRWQAPRPVKLAWQSRDGIARIPTPTGASILGVAGSMSAQSILTYLNETGEMDDYIDYVRGLDFETIMLYVGANILLKNYIGGDITIDPLSANILATMGSQAITRTLPGLPGGIIAANPKDNISLAIGKAKTEDALGLLPGSLRTLGWNGVLENTGKRYLEEVFGLPTLYLETNSLEQLNKLDTVKAALDNFNEDYQPNILSGGGDIISVIASNRGGANRIDDGMNVPVGTIELLKRNDQKAFVLAGINLVSTAFKLSDAQKTTLTTAIQDGTTPNLDASAFSVSGALSNVALESMFSTNHTNANDEMSRLGNRMIAETLDNITGSSYATLIVDKITKAYSTGSRISTEDLLLEIGATALGVELGIEQKDADKLASNPGGSLLNEVAKLLNESLDLATENQLTSGDIAGITNSSSQSIIEKIGADQVDKAVNWNNGTALQILHKEKTLKDGFEEAFANALSEILNLPKGSISLKGNTVETAALAVIEQRLGLPAGTLKDFKNAQAIFEKIGKEKFKELFGVDDPSKVQLLNSPIVEEKLKLYDVTLGLEPGTIKKFLSGEEKIENIIKSVIEQNKLQFTASNIWNYFGLDEQYQLSGEDFQNIITVFFTDGEKTSQDQKEKAIASIHKILGRTIDSKTLFAADTIYNYITAPNKTDATKILLNQGIAILVKAIGVNIEGVDVEMLTSAAKDLHNAFRNGTAELEKSRKELDELSKKDPKKLTAAEQRRLNELKQSVALKVYQKAFDVLTDFFIDATGIPKEFIDDARAFIAGDYKTALAGASFALWEELVNKYLPTGSKLTYAEFRDSVDFTDSRRIDERYEKLVKESGDKNLTDAEKEELRRQARKELMDETRKRIEYRISDAFLRKLDPNIPAGFTEIMMRGTQEQKVELLERWAINQLDKKLSELDPTYIPGTLEKIYNGSAEEAQRALLNQLIAKTGISLNIGPLNVSETADYLRYLIAPNSQRSQFYTDSKYSTMWASVDKWFASLIGTGNLPTGFSKSVFYAAQNNWNLKAELKDANGKVIVASLQSLGEEFLVSTLTRWGDKALGLPTGSVYRIYQGVKAVSDASRAYHAAKALGDTTKITAASKSLANAQAELTMIAITIALNACSACQQLFASIDQALAAPPGFTNALVSGIIAMALGLGPAGLIVAAAIYLFGVYKVEYLCPLPPKDPYALAGYDNSYDISTVGYPIDPNKTGLVSGSPSDGQNPFDWDDNIPFSDGNNPELWMGWARYYVGYILDKSLKYSEAKSSRDKIRQLITYRQANAEFFAVQKASDGVKNLLEAAFDDDVKENEYIGIGFSQRSTKTTDWVHATFGGLY
ncbi:hypothetical protein HY844_02590 [Candidatus Berkelbacteria bacterium]|nr:hypothetical protein [Candidatus Berkelbacteria bacterium]